jgi:hypothetical protein
MPAKGLAHFYKVCLFTNKVRVVGFANRVLRKSFLEKIWNPCMRYLAFFLTHPLSSAEALAQVNFLLYPPAAGKDDSFEGCWYRSFV